MRTSVLSLLCSALLLTACTQAAEPVLGGPCEGCELVFAGQPAEIAAQASIAPVGEPGEPLQIDGVVSDRNGKPAAGIIIYAYQTDARGHYPRAETRHGRLRGWARSDAEGRFRFDTIRPASYPETDIPQHVHLHVIEPGRGTYYIDDLVFSDDPLLTSRQRTQILRGRGGNGLATPQRDADGVWHATRDIRLGAGIGAGSPAGR